MRSTQYDNFLSDQINECMQSVTSVWEDALKYKIQDSANEMKDLYGKLIDLQQDLKNYRDARGYADEGYEFDDILRMAENLKHQREDQNRNDKEVQISNVLSRIKGDDDIIIEEGQPTLAGLLCPITNKLPIKPVIAKRCKHVFDKDAIMGYIAQRTGGRNMSVPCPCAACNNHISISDIISDEEVSRRVEEARNATSQLDEYEQI
jgi:SUMO ligase MMS21 Smc5/6 complex component